MKNYTYREGDLILQELINNPNKKDKLILSEHFKKRSKLRRIDEKYVQDMILNQEPIGVLSSRKNRFKLFYPSNKDKSFDLIVIIAIEDNKNIILLTTFEDKKSKREGTK